MKDSEDSAAFASTGRRTRRRVQQAHRSAVSIASFRKQVDGWPFANGPRKNENVRFSPSSYSPCLRQEKTPDPIFLPPAGSSKAPHWQFGDFVLRPVVAPFAEVQDVGDGHIQNILPFLIDVAAVDSKPRAPFVELVSARLPRPLREFI